MRVTDAQLANVLARRHDPANFELAMRTFLDEEHTSPERMWSHLAATAQRDLLLGLSALALLRGPESEPGHGRGHAENRAVLHTLYVL